MILKYSEWQDLFYRVTLSYENMGVDSENNLMVKPQNDDSIIFQGENSTYEITMIIRRKEEE